MQIKHRPFLTFNGVDVWFETLAAGDVEYQNYRQLLSAEEQLIAQHFVRDLHRDRYVVCHGKLRLLLSNYLNIAPDSICFARQAFGKPYIVDASGQPDPLQFNLSHSNSLMLLAVGRVPLGIDLEVWDDRHDLASLADECLAPAEKGYWQALPADEQVPAFYRFWTRKESLVKAVGAGIGIGIAGVVTSTVGAPGFTALPDECRAIGDWRLVDLELGPGISGALTEALLTANVIQE